MPRLNRKSGDRRLVDMSGEQGDTAWEPDLPGEEPPWEDEIFISERVKYLQIVLEDQWHRLVEWVVVQSRLVDGRWHRVAVYDLCHGKGVHVHLYDRDEVEFCETPLRAVESYQDVEDGLEYAVDRVTRHWDENERRSDRGR